ncbi:hypothetical protein CPB83DRAFT_859906 [Crepidotus variabilis]|uniref:Uncharacterized protein n=1 Tax=Crepidotus variabilis TaxID=179855 RepID=A0A9P6EA08_9AGAR|nr:hypothetical protein CPB83DRAFT_859906 [Crepidotus variabilis]
MKISFFLSLVLASTISSTIACVNSVGTINTSGDHFQLQTAYIIDNGQDTCDSARGYSTSTSTWVINCIGGYSMQVDTSGHNVWYGTPHGSFTWQQATSQNGQFITWNVNEFC